MNKDPLVALGKIIRQEREARNWTVDDFARESRLSPKFIVAIEDGRRDELPEEAFLMGFLNIAAKTLKLDARAIEKYKDMEASFILETIVNDETPAKIPYSYRYREPWLKIYHLYIIAALVLVLMFSTWVLKQMKPATTKIVAPAATALKKPERVKIEATEELEVTAAKAEPRKSSGQHQLTLKAKHRAWLQVIALGENNILFEGYISPSAKAYTFADDMGLYVSTADAGAFDIDIGRGFYKLGAKGQAVKWYYPPSAKMKYKEEHGSVL